MYKTTFLGVLEAEKLQKHKCTLFSETPCSFPANPKVLFVTALNALKLSLVNSVRRIGINCEAVTSDNLLELLNSSTPVLFISPEVLKQAAVTQILIIHRTKFVLKVVDEAHLGKTYKIRL